LVSASKTDEGKQVAADLYKTLQSEKIEVLFDDREGSIGEKLADADLMGMPIRIVVGDKSLEAGGVGIKMRNSTEPEKLFHYQK